MFSGYEKLHLFTLATQRICPSGAGLLDRSNAFVQSSILALCVACTRPAVLKRLTQILGMTKCDPQLYVGQGHWPRGLW